MPREQVNYLGISVTGMSSPGQNLARHWCISYVRWRYVSYGVGWWTSCRSLLCWHRMRKYSYVGECPRGNSLYWKLVYVRVNSPFSSLSHIWNPFLSLFLSLLYSRVQEGKPRSTGENCRRNVFLVKIEKAKHDAWLNVIDDGVKWCNLM